MPIKQISELGKDSMFWDKDALTERYYGDRFLLDKEKWENLERQISRCQVYLAVVHPILQEIKPGQVFIYESKQWRVKNKDRIRAINETFQIRIEAETFKIPDWQKVNGQDFSFQENGKTVLPSFNFDTDYPAKMLLNGQRITSLPCPDFINRSSPDKNYKVSEDGAYISYNFDLDIVPIDKIPKIVQRMWANDALVFDRSWYSTQEEWTKGQLKDAKAGTKMKSLVSDQTKDLEIVTTRNEELQRPGQQVTQPLSARPKRRRIGYEADEDKGLVSETSQ